MGKRRLTAIDLYSGVGGWSLGLKMAGIDVVASYDRWAPANETNERNNGHPAWTVDLRKMPLAEIPRNIDIVVGSPPCTEFSFSNRGGGGDLADGLKDITTFFKIVAHVQPRFWAMENVPRVSKIILHELKRGGLLTRFASLGPDAKVLSAEDFGVPQRRRRCVVGNFDFSLLAKYSAQLRVCTLGKVITSLSGPSISDPIYNLRSSASQLVDHIYETPLNIEEVRINRANKTSHPIYNSMPFPDSLSRPARTVTATCTRVSRESIIISDERNKGTFRRLTVRERACLQGFPISFQFYGKNHGDKIKMVGNAMPPPLAFYIANAMKRTCANLMPSLSDAVKAFKPPIEIPDKTCVDVRNSRFPANRTFRFAIPSLRLKSGVRFELCNKTPSRELMWHVGFFFGSSKEIQSLTMDNALFQKLVRRFPAALKPVVHRNCEEFIDFLQAVDFGRLQQVWSHRGPGSTRPFEILDRLDSTAALIREILATQRDWAQTLVVDCVKFEYGKTFKNLVGVEKLRRHADLILTGLLVGSLTNSFAEKNRSHIDEKVFRFSAVRQPIDSAQCLRRHRRLP